MASLSELCNSVVAKLASEQEALANREAALRAELADRDGEPSAEVAGRRGQEAAPQRSREQIKEEKDQQEEKEEMPNLGASENDVLHLNAGGELFMVKRSTLLLAPKDSLFNAMFSGRWDHSLSKDSEGRIFLEMSPEVFSLILSYLRILRLDPASKKKARKNTRSVRNIVDELFPTDNNYKAELVSACDYYGIFLSEQLTTPRSLKMTGESMVLNCEEGIVCDVICTFGSASSNMGRRAWAIGCDEITETMAWKLETVCPGHWVWIGITSSVSPHEESYKDFTSYGWGSAREVYQAGLQPRLEGSRYWSDWNSGDEAILKLDLENSCLRMYHCRINNTFCLQLPQRDDISWRLHVNIPQYNPQGHPVRSIRVSIPTPDELQLVD